MYEYKATIVNVVDGDTYDLDIDLGFHIHIHERVRILDLDTPEKRGSVEKELGLICTQFAQHFVGKNVIINSKQELSPKTDSFGRWLVSARFEDGSDIAGIFTSLGCNKFSDNYNEKNVLLLKELSYDGLFKC